MLQYYTKLIKHGKKDQIKVCQNKKFNQNI